METEGNKFIGVQYSSQFDPISKGMAECPKCFGAVEIDMTMRDASGWPLGPPVRVTCDFCDGEGEVLPKRAKEAEPGWGAPMVPGPVKIEPGWGAVQPETTVSTGWGDFDDWQVKFNQLNTRTKNCLIAANINSTTKLNAETDLDLMILPAFGAGCMRNIRQVFGRTPDGTTADHPNAMIRSVTDV